MRGYLRACCLLMLISLFVLPSAMALNKADLDGSGKVDAKDLLIFHENWFAKEVDTPGITSTIQSVVIPADNIPEVTFTLLDSVGDPLPPGSLRRYRFVLARIIEDNLAQNRTHFENYFTRSMTGSLGSVQVPTYDSTGSTTPLPNGQFRYKFSRAITGMNPSLTHVLAMQLEYELNGIRVVSNPIYYFRPDGNPVTTKRELSDTATCNNCHTRLSVHGGSRREYVMCLLCHYPGVTDGNGVTLDMAQMTHQIHLGSQFQGANNVAGATDGINSATEYYNYGHVHFPMDIRNCQACHVGPQANYHKTVPSQRACSGCHDKTNANTGVNHAPGSFTDSACTFCHGANQTSEFDITIPGAHVVPAKSASLPTLNIEILDVTGVAVGQRPWVKFKIARTLNGVTTFVAPGDLNRVALVFGGATETGKKDYMFDRTDNITNANSVNHGDGSYSFTSGYVFPATATGTWAFSMEARTASQTLGGESVRAGAVNPIVYRAITGDVEPRRKVVDIAKCNKCHDMLSLHGNNRNDNPQNCAICHRPGRTDAGQRPPAQNPPESIDFKVMIHKIHTGEDLANGYLAYGFGNTPHDYSDVLYPGDRRVCETCHDPGTYGPVAPAGAVDTVITQGGVEIKRTKPTTSACTGCHDSDEVAAHAAAGTVGGVEQCATCHGPGQGADVTLFHKLP